MSWSPRMTPIKYELAIKYGSYELRLYAKEVTAASGYSVIDGAKIITGKSLPGLRKHGVSLAKHFSVPFVDLTVGKPRHEH